MPELLAPPQEQDVDLERIDYLFGGDQTPDDKTALKLVKSTFGKYEGQRLTVERRWDAAARLYHGVIDQRKWPGTDIDRAALAVPIVYDKIEAAYPIICESLFSYYPTFFEVSPMPGTTPQQAAQQRDVLSAYLETPFDDSGITPVAHLKMAVKQAEKYGDGAIKLSWDAQQKRFIVEWVDVRDLYLDPTAPGPSADWSPAVIERMLMTVEDLADLRGTTGVNIPSDKILNYLAKARYVTSGDVTKQREASARRETYYVGDLRTDPRHQLIEVLCYWTKDRLIWTLGRIWTAINQENPYGFIPYCRAPYSMVEGRPYSMGLAEILEGDQKYAQGIRNARIDNLSLALNPPRTRAQGTPTTPGATAWRPGLEDRVSDPKQVEVHKVENVTSDAYREEEIIHQGASQRVGVNAMAESGVPTPSNANRTAGGVSAQQRSVGTRLSTPVGYFEDFLIVPMLYKAAKMLAKFAPEQFEVTGKDGKPVQATKSDFQKGVHFRMEASNRMIVKERLASFLGPITTLLFNEGVMHQANVQGMTLDFTEWARFFQDATGTSKAYTFFRPMEPQEQQQMNQPDPKTMADMQKAQMEQQTRLQMGQMKAKTESDKAQLDYQAKTHGTSERSATELLKLLATERADQWRHIDDKSKSRGDS